MGVERVQLEDAEVIGVAGLVARASARPLVLMRGDRAVAIVDGSGDVIESLDHARTAVLAVAADLSAGRSEWYSLDEACERLGLDAAAVRRRSEAARHAALDDHLS
jgi:hypothetical protein